MISRKFNLPSAVLTTSLLMLMAGCATVVKGTTQTVKIDTPKAAGAVCELNSRGVGTHKVTTPGEIVLPKSRHNIEITCRKECYEDGEAVLASRMAGATAGNILIGGGIGAAIDASSGAMFKYEPQIEIEMKKLPKCKPKPTRQPATGA